MIHHWMFLFGVIHNQMGLSDFDCLPGALTSVLCSWDSDCIGVASLSSSSSDELAAECAVKSSTNSATVEYIGPLFSFLHNKL